MSPGTSARSGHPARRIRGHPTIVPRQLRMVALTEIGRYVEAEREAQTHADWDDPAEHAFLLDVIRLLDQCAATASTDLRQRRFGLVLRLVVEPLMRDQPEVHARRSERAQDAAHSARPAVHRRCPRRAKRSLCPRLALGRHQRPAPSRPRRTLHSRLEVLHRSGHRRPCRLRLQTNAAGSPVWFDARYALALAYYHSGQFKESAQLIDATSILHPDLGGGELQEKFIRLRQRLGSKP